MIQLFNKLTLAALICLLTQRLAAFPFDGEPSEQQPDQHVVTDTLDELAIDPQVLATVRHPDFGLTSREVRDEERDAYYHILKKARDAELKKQKAAARQWRNERLRLPKYQRYRDDPDHDFPTFVDLIKNTDLYHGKLVTLRGHVRKLIVIAEKKQGIDKFYEAWLYTEHSQNHPAVIVCTWVPKGMPMGASILVDHVSVTGYFFKNFRYIDQAKTARYAPMILAQRLEWHPPAAPAPPLIPQWLIYLMIVAGMAAAVVLVARMTSKDREFRNKRLRPPEVDSADIDLENLSMEAESDQQ